MASHTISRDNSLEELKKALPKNETEKSFYIFISIDLVNSTALKNRDPGWPIVITKFYEITKKEIKDKLSASVWKFVGDEILFYKKISSENDLLEDANSLFSTSESLKSSLQNLFPHHKEFISIKTGV